MSTKSAIGDLAGIIGGPVVTAPAKPSPVGVGVRNARSLVWISADVDAANYAQGLYANLRTLDAAQTSVILVESSPINMAPVVPPLAPIAAVVAVSRQPRATFSGWVV